MSPAGVEVMERGAPGWPPGLEHLPQVPVRLWVTGAHRPRRPAVAVVGARRATLTGLAVARSLARDLAALGAQVVSGLALGIDGAAHRGALDGGGSTAAVLGCGIDVCYPRTHATLMAAVAAQGCIVSEEPPGTEPARWLFPKRNRIIAALADAVVVVEAGERSGALSTARHAADLGREVLAVPGSIRSDRSTGTNRLIRDGAAPLLGLEDLLAAVPALAALAAGAPPAAPDPQGAAAGAAARLDRVDADILRAAGGGPVHPDDIAHALGTPPAELAARLSVLEVAGWVHTDAGGLVARIPSPSDPPPDRPYGAASRPRRNSIRAGRGSRDPLLSSAAHRGRPPDRAASAETS